MKLRFFQNRNDVFEGLDFLNHREQFIPFRIDVLLDRMVRDPQMSPEDGENFRLLRRMLADRFHYEFYATLESLKNDFVPFDPDCETLAEPDFTEAELQIFRVRLYDAVIRLLHAGNYTELTANELDECLKLQPMGGLSVHVDTADFDEFHVFYRGIRQRDEQERFLFLWQWKRPVTYMNRVFVLARFKKECGGHVLLKMFKDVAVENIKIVAPKVKLGMPIFDRIKIGGSVLGSLFAPLSKLIFAFTLSWIYFLIILSGFIIAAVKGVLSFMNSRTKYMQVFSSSLYYRNLSNNKSAITALVDAAEDQEIKESLIAYYILHKNQFDPLSSEQIDQKAEQWIENEFAHRVDFEIKDALRKLREKNILQTEGSSPNVYRVSGLTEALQTLDASWDNIHHFESVTKRIKPKKSS